MAEGASDDPAALCVVDPTMLPASASSGLNLLVAAIILWNTRYLQAAFDAMRARGRTIPPELVGHVAPLGWEHISLTADYVWAADGQPARGALRPLRDRPSLLAA